MTRAHSACVLRLRKAFFGCKMGGAADVARETCAYAQMHFCVARAPAACSDTAASTARRVGPQHRAWYDSPLMSRHVRRPAAGRRRRLGQAQPRRALQGASTWRWPAMASSGAARAAIFVATSAALASAVACFALASAVASTPISPSYDVPLPSVVSICVLAYPPFVMQRVRAGASVRSASSSESRTLCRTGKACGCLRWPRRPDLTSRTA